MTARVRLVTWFLAGMAVAGVPSTGAAQDPMADMGAINAVLANLRQAYVRADAVALAALMAQDVQGFGSLGTVNGLAEFAKAAPALLEGVRDVRVLGRQDVTMSGNLAYVAFVNEVQRTGRPGAENVRQRWTVVLQRRDDRWQIVHYHVSPLP